MSITKTPRERVLFRAVLADRGCWNWTGYLDREGYGQIQLNNRKMLAHRASYEAFVGPIPNGLELDHLCRNPRCVNPKHLEPVTRQENERRKPRPPKEVCRNGHVQDGETRRTTVRSNGGIHRACRRCEAAASSRYQRRNSEAVSS